MERVVYDRKVDGSRGGGEVGGSRGGELSVREEVRVRGSEALREAGRWESGWLVGIKREGMEECW